MTVKISDFREETRALLFDVSGGAYPDGRIDEGVRTAWRHLESRNGAARYGADGRLREVAFEEGEDTEWWFSEAKWKRGLEYYAAAFCLEANMKDTVKMEMAAALYQKAEAIFA